jgi:hypothetical protein
LSFFYISFPETWLLSAFFITSFPELVFRKSSNHSPLDSILFLLLPSLVTHIPLPDLYKGSLTYSPHPHPHTHTHTHTHTNSSQRWQL